MMKFVILSIAFFTMCVAESDLRFAVVSDRTGAHVDRVFEEILEEAELLAPDFIINVGDVIEGYEPDTLLIKAQWDSIMSITSALSCPFYFVPGNHDIQNDNDRRILEAMTGKKSYYSFDRSNNHFIVIDNSPIYAQLAPNIDSAQLAWLRSDLETARKKDNIFVFFHVPTWSSSWNNAAADSMEALFEQYRVKAVFTGHHHTYTYFEQNGTKYITLSSSGGGMDDLDIGKGHVYSYLFVTVRGKEADIAVVKKGAVLKPDFFTLEDDTLVYKIFRDAFNFSPCLVPDDGRKTAHRFKVSVLDFGPDSIKQDIRWSFDAKKYTISPVEFPLSIASGETKDLDFQLTVLNGSDIYPLPQLQTLYAYKHEKACTVNMNASLIKRIAPVLKVQRPPVIDGNLDDAAWKKIKPLADLTSSQYGSGGSAIDPTEYYLAHDADNLYMGIRCNDKDLSKIKALATEQDGETYYDDNIWFFLDSDLDQETYYQAIINSNAAVFDRSCSLKDGVSKKDGSWNGPWEVKAGKEPDAWILEIKIPKKELAPFSEKQWGFAFRRLQTRLGDAGWQIPFGHNPANFGILEFK